MKQKVFWFSVFLLSANSVQARLGNEGSGGGNALGSTPAEVVEYIDNELWRDLEFPRNMMALLDPKTHLPARDPKVRQMLSEMLAKAKPFLPPGNYYGDHQELSPIRFEKKMTGACLHDGEERDASVETDYDSQGGILEIRICYSVERLTRFPASQLPSQLLGLTMHELAHALIGANEVDATFLQDYWIEKNRIYCKIQLYFGIREDMHIKIPSPLTEIRRFRLNDTKYSWESTAQVRAADGSMHTFHRIELLERQFFKLNWDPSTEGQLEFAVYDRSGREERYHLNWWKLEASQAPIVNPEIFDIYSWDVRGVKTNFTSVNGMGSPMVRMTKGCWF